MFTVGQKVACRDGKFSPSVVQFFVALPVEGKVYTVRAVKVGISPAGEEGEIAIYLQELVNPKSSKPPFPERGFSAMRFVPLLENVEEQVLIESRTAELLKGEK